MAVVSALAVGAGGAAGALARYAVGRRVARRAVDTLAVNAGGSFLLGAVLGVGLDGTPWLALAVGFCGAFTTFSSFAVDTVRLAEDGATVAAGGYALATLALALAALLLGTAAGGLV